jgi:hypothetical protein
MLGYFGSLSGLGNIANKVIKACAEELAPVMSHIFQLGLTTGELPSDWRNANMRFDLMYFQNGLLLPSSSVDSSALLT